jgi:hypothetical protein
VLPTTDRADALGVPETSYSKKICAISLYKGVRILATTLASDVCLDFTYEMDFVLLIPIVSLFKTGSVQDVLMDSDW